MKILFTNNTLDQRAGTELVVVELATRMQRRGHMVAAYTSHPGTAADILRADHIPVVDDLSELPFRPDVIHAQHHLDAMTALAALPGAPAIYHIHGVVWQERPPVHPRILRYLAVSEIARQRAVTEVPLPEEQVELFLNTVDLTRFPAGRQGDGPPAKALLFNNNLRPGDPMVTAIEKACAATGLQLDKFGSGFGHSESNPEKHLPAYDLVFASARSALEGMACGCGVILIERRFNPDVHKVGPLLTSANYDAKRRINFAYADSPPDASYLEAQIRSFDRAAAAAVSARIRGEADLDLACDRLENLYAQIARAGSAMIPDPAAEVAAMGRYLRGLTPLIKAVDGFLGGNWTKAGEIRGLARRLRKLESREARLLARLKEADAERKWIDQHLESHFLSKTVRRELEKYRRHGAESSGHAASPDEGTDE